MPVRKREFKSGVKWCVDVLFPNGKRYKRVIGTKKQAEKVQKMLESEIVEGKWKIRETEDVPFSALAVEYLEYAEANKAASTFYCDRCRIEGHLLPYLGDTPLNQITPQMVDNYKQLRIRERASPNTVNHEITNLSHMLRMAIRWRYIDWNVVSSVDKMKVPERSPRFLNRAEVHRLTEATRSSHIYPLIMTTLHTGMRKSEVRRVSGK
jgi:integrase